MERIEEETRTTTVTIPGDVANTEAAATAAEARKAEFDKVRKKILIDHDGLFRRLAQ